MTMQEQSRYETRSGRVVKVQENGGIVFDHVNGYITSEVVPDAEEFFEARKDDELGRWRWPEDRKFVVYGRDDGGARVVDETTGDNWFYRREDAVHVGDPYFAASAFWEAHPARPVWADAEAVIWRNGAYLPQVAQRDLGERNNGWWWCDEQDGGRWRSEAELARIIGTAEVRILVATSLTDTDGARR